MRPDDTIPAPPPVSIAPLLEVLANGEQAIAFYRRLLEAELDMGGGPMDAIALQARIARGAAIVRALAERLDVLVGETGAIRVG